MNPVIAQHLLDFVIQEGSNHPEFIGGLIQHLLTKSKLDPTLQADVVALIEQLLPILLSGIKK